jgi:hypothetical protein
LRAGGGLARVGSGSRTAREISGRLERLGGVGGDKNSACDVDAARARAGGTRKNLQDRERALGRGAGSV